MPHWSSSRPAASTQLMIRLAAEHGVSVATCVVGTGLTEADLTDPAREIEGRQELAVLRNILRNIDPTVPFALTAGLQYRPTMQGMWGLAVLSSPDVRSAIEVGLRYFDLSYSFNRVRFEVVDGLGRFVYEDQDNPEDLRAALVERDIGALVTLERTDLGAATPCHSLHLRAAPPPYAEVLESLFGVVPRFNAEENFVSFDVTVLDARQPLGDRLGLSVCEEQCRELLERRKRRAGMAGRVRDRLLRDPRTFPDMTTVAAELGMSTRTLRNHLMREQTTYRELLEEIRETIAEGLLLSTGLTVDEIAERVGYSDTSSFVAAFRRWKGVPPRGYRRDRVGR